MTTVLYSHSIQKDGEEIKVEVVDTELGIVVNVNGVQVKVNVNGETFYQHFDKEEYKYIPLNLRQFCSDNDFDYFELEDKKVPHFYLTVQGREFACHIVTRKNKRYLTMRDWAMDTEKIHERCGLDEDFLKVGNDAFAKLNEFIKEAGYDFLFSHDADEYDTVHYLEVPVEKFNEEKVQECIQKWAEYNDTLRSYIK